MEGKINLVKEVEILAMKKKLELSEHARKSLCRLLDLPHFSTWEGVYEAVKLLKNQK